jgi:RNA polymerase sigma factor (sigma-70 family)
MHSDPNEDERSLIEQCLAGNIRAWDRFLETHHKTIASIASWRKWGFDQAEREDVVQDILEGVIKSLPRFEFRARVSTFVYRVSVTSCIAALRKRAARKKRFDLRRSLSDLPNNDWEDKNDQVEINSIKNPEKLLLQRESISAMQRALAHVGESCKQLIGFRYFDELSFAEIAEATGVKENTLVVRLKRCLARLLEFMQRET